MWRDLYRLQVKVFFALIFCGVGKMSDHACWRRKWIYSQPNLFPRYWRSLLSIWVLAGDNAIVIALVARKLAQHLQRITILGGTIGAVAVRIGMTLAIVWLLDVPGLLLVGGVLLVRIAYKFLAPM